MKRLLVFLLIVAISFGAGYGAQQIEEHVIRSKHPLEYEEYINEYTTRFDVPKDLIYAMIKCESGFVSNAVSSAGAVGLMQLKPATLSDMMTRLGEDEYSEGLLYDPETNIKYGTYYIRYLFDVFCDWDIAIAAYNAGMGNVRGWLKNEAYYDGVKLIKIPFPETASYIEKIDNARKVYTELYFSDTAEASDNENEA